MSASILSEISLLNAAGTLSKENVHAVKDVYDALVTKTITPEPREGNSPPRLSEATGGMVNSIGLQNPGIERFLSQDLDEWCAAGLPVIVSVGGSRNQDFDELCCMLAEEPRVAAIELNLSCPNNYETGQSFCANPEDVEIIVAHCAHTLRFSRGEPKPLIAKLSAENAVCNALWAQEDGADAVTLINTLPALTWPRGASQPHLGGLSGPALKVVALRAVWDVAQEGGIRIIGSGGVYSGQDVMEFMSAGAEAVQIGTASFVRDPMEIRMEWEELCKK